MINSSVKRALWAHAFCKYDTFLFGFLASVIKPIFFPTADVAASLAIFATFASGYIIRPLGGLFFSHIGDRFGRKNAFMMTILFILLPSLFISVLPGYAVLGICAPVLLILARITQGFGAGGEFSGAITYSSELTKSSMLGTIGGIVRSVGFLSTAIGTGIAALLTLSFMPDWSWRIAFLLGACMSAVSYYLRRHMVETNDFAEIHIQNQITKTPIIEAFKEYKINLLALFLVSSAAYSFLYFTTIYLNSLYIDKLGLESSFALLISSILLVVWTVVTPLSGYFADRTGIVKYLKSVTTFLTLIVPLIFYLLLQDLTIEGLLSIHIILSLCGSIFFGPVPALFKIIFPTPIRYTGTAVSNAFAQVLIGSLNPFYATLIFSYTHSFSSTGFVLIAALLLGGIGLYLCDIIQKRRVHEDNILKDIIYDKKLSPSA